MRFWEAADGRLHAWSVVQGTRSTEPCCRGPMVTAVGSGRVRLRLGPSEAARSYEREGPSRAPTRPLEVSLPPPSPLLSFAPELSLSERGSSRRARSCATFSSRFERFRSASAVTRFLPEPAGSAPPPPSSRALGLQQPPPHFLGAPLRSLPPTIRVRISANRSPLEGIPATRTTLAFPPSLPPSLSFPEPMNILYC